LFPDRAALFVASIEDEEYRNEKVDFWDSVYNVDMSCVKNHVLHEPLVDTFNGQLVNSNECCILDIDLKTCTVE
jgi:protein arginine N-methyltransferase 1